MHFKHVKALSSRQAHTHTQPSPPCAVTTKGPQSARPIFVIALVCPHRDLVPPTHTYNYIHTSLTYTMTLNLFHRIVWSAGYRRSEQIINIIIIIIIIIIK